MTSKQNTSDTKTATQPGAGAAAPLEKRGGMGTLYGVSLGPGDPDLITRRGWQLLQRTDTVWTYPVRSTRRESYALGIVQRSGIALPAQHHALLFPMTHDTEKLSRHWLKAGQQVLELLQTGQDVLFLVEGDASTYATFGYLAQSVTALQPAVQVETVPGVTSFHACAARLGMPLSEQDDTIAIVPAAYGVDMIARLLTDFDTLVLMKVKPLLDEIIALMESKGLAQHCTFIEKAGAPEERIVTDITRLKGQTVNYLSLLLVKNPQRIRGERIRGCKKKSTATPTAASASAAVPASAVAPSQNI